MFPYPSGLKAHLKNKKPCHSPAAKKGLYPCKYCDEQFTQQGNKSRHESKRCLKRPQPDSLLGALLAQMSELQKQVATLQPVVAHHSAEYNTQVNAPMIVQNNTVFHQSVFHFNFWGHEDITFIDKEYVKNSLDEAIKKFPHDKTGEVCAPWVVNGLVQQVFSNPARPHNLTAYIPNKKDKIPTVHRETGWRKEPLIEYDLFISRILDQFYINQPFDENHEKYGKILIHMRENEKTLYRTIVPSNLETNKGLLLRVLGVLPQAGDPPIVNPMTCIGAMVVPTCPDQPPE
jgi:hypothetical protein